MSIEHDREQYSRIMALDKQIAALQSALQRATDELATGWQCPCCKHVFAPYIEECPYCFVQNTATYEISNERRIEMVKEREALFTGPLTQSEDEINGEQE